VRIFKEFITNNAFDCPQEVKGQRIVHVDTSGDNSFIWYEFDENNPEDTFHYLIVGTGWDYFDKYQHAGTFIQAPFVWHVIVTYDL